MCARLKMCLYSMVAGRWTRTEWWYLAWCHSELNGNYSALYCTIALKKTQPLYYLYRLLMAFMAFRFIPEATRVCVCACLLCEWSRVYNKWQMAYKDALRSLTHILSSMLTSHCVVKLYPWHVFCISHSRNCFGWNPGAFWSAVGKLIKQHVNVNKAKETSSSCHCCG